MHNRFQGNHGAKVRWVALEKAIVFLPVITAKVAKMFLHV